MSLYIVGKQPQTARTETKFVRSWADCVSEGRMPLMELKFLENVVEGAIVTRILALPPLSVSLLFKEKDIIKEILQDPRSAR